MTTEYHLTGDEIPAHRLFNDLLDSGVDIPPAVSITTDHYPSLSTDWCDYHAGYEGWEVHVNEQLADDLWDWYVGCVEAGLIRSKHTII